jgi:hypothetical protein
MLSRQDGAEGGQQYGLPWQLSVLGMLNTPYAKTNFTLEYSTHQTPRRKTSIIAVSMMKPVSLIKFWMLKVEVSVSVHTNRPPKLSTAGTIVSHFEPADKFLIAGSVWHQGPKTIAPTREGSNTCEEEENRRPEPYHAKENAHMAPTVLPVDAEVYFPIHPVHEAPVHADI